MLTYCIRNFRAITDLKFVAACFCIHFVLSQTVPAHLIFFLLKIIGLFLSYFFVELKDVELAVKTMACHSAAKRAPHEYTRPCA